MSIAVDTARIALLGCGTVGSAFARLARAEPARVPFEITGALVRHAREHRDQTLPPLTTDAATLLRDGADVLVELLGGIEPARSLILAALARRIPVVTANKSLLAHHGAELRAAALATRTPLLYEAAVIAGVPFLGTFSRRPRAATATGLTAILNGTTNYILTRTAADGSSIADALVTAQRLGYAEPDPLADVSGQDARDKLAVLLQQFAGRHVHPESIETTSIEQVRGAQVTQARELDGVIKPVAIAEWSGDDVQACTGPAFVPNAHPLAAVDGVENALILDTPRGRLLFQGPGAGPDVTAATVLDDVQEALAGGCASTAETLASGPAAAPLTGWLITLEAARLPRGADVADYLASHGLFAHRVSTISAAAGRESRSLLLWPAPGAAVEQAIQGLCAAGRCQASALRALGDPR